jgi:hypothetical protein
MYSLESNSKGRDDTPFDGTTNNEQLNHNFDVVDDVVDKVDAGMLKNAHDA